MVSHLCVFCQRRVYLMERLSAEGFFFHRSCFRCSQCRNLLRAAAYSFHPPSGESPHLPYTDRKWEVLKKEVTSGGSDQLWPLCDKA